MAKVVKCNYCERKIEGGADAVLLSPGTLEFTFGIPWIQAKDGGEEQFSYSHVGCLPKFLRDTFASVRNEGHIDKVVSELPYLVDSINCIECGQQLEFERLDECDEYGPIHKAQCAQCDITYDQQADQWIIRAWRAGKLGGYK